MRLRFVPKSMTLDGIERPKRTRAEFNRRSQALNCTLRQQACIFFSYIVTYAVSVTNPKTLTLWDAPGGVAYSRITSRLSHSRCVKTKYRRQQACACLHTAFSCILYRYFYGAMLTCDQILYKRQRRNTRQLCLAPANGLATVHCSALWWLTDGA